MLTALDRLRRVGRDLALAGLVSTRGGNLSVRTGERILVTRTGAALGHLEAESLVEVPAERAAPGDEEASSDLLLHREIYRSRGVGAIVHAHPPAVTALTFAGEVIEPVDHEGRLLMPTVQICEETDPREGLARRAADAVAAGDRVVAVRGHGTYAAGESPEDACHWTTALEMSARILLDLRAAGLTR